MVTDAPANLKGFTANSCSQPVLARLGFRQKSLVETEKLPESVFNNSSGRQPEAATRFQIGKWSIGANFALSSNQIAIQDRCKVT